MKKILFFLSVLFFSYCSFAQTVNEIKNSSLYLWGEGSGKTRNAAIKEALSDLISKISVEVSSEFTIDVEETEEEYRERVNSIVKTYSIAKINDTKGLTISDEPNAKELRYILKSDLQKQFADRRNKIVYYASYAVEAEKNNKISDALRQYYWALTLLSSYPKSDTVTFVNGEPLFLFLPKRINSIFQGLKADVVNVEKEENKQSVELFITYNGNPVQNYDFTYFDGQNYSNIVSAKDGRSIIELSNLHDIKNIALRSEYAFESEAVYEEDLKTIFDRMTEIIPFHTNKISVNDNREKGKKLLAKETKEIKAKETNLFEMVEDHNSYLDIITEIENAIKYKKYNEVQNLFTVEGFDCFQRLIEYGNVKLLSNEIGYSFYKFDNGVICRSMPMKFCFSNNKEFVESVVFEFDEKKKIRSLSFQLEQEAVSDIFSKNRWDKASKNVLIRFLENYKTAYALKRLDYLEKIFSDNALIIVGSTVVKPQSIEKGRIRLNEKETRLNQYNKEEYMKNLKKCFDKNEFINLRFTENDIKKFNKEKEVYGIQIKQDYFSSTYGDSGYLFLGVDVENAERPIIYIRTWQPEKDKDGKVFGVNDFVID
jgi:hypothetical protein